MNEKAATGFAPWRLKGIGVLRIVFGLVWAVDAWFKWQPEFINKFADSLSGAGDGQPAWIHHWIGFWNSTIGIDPHVFAHLVAIGETAIAVGLLLGIFSNLNYVLGVLLSLIIWSTAEGFGGPYGAGSTDIGAAIIYPLVFAGLYLGLDGKLSPLLGRFGFLGTGNAGQPSDPQATLRPALSH
ncbi:MAG: hypothetical protein ACYDGR_05110 [Candidatus Dormibacteria bacterium]